MRSLLLVVVLAQSAWAQDPLVLRQRLAKLLKLSLTETVTSSSKPVPVLSPLACQVLGTMQSRVIEVSLALVQCGKGARSMHVGDPIEDGIVEEIGFGTVTVRRGDRLEFLSRGVALASKAPASTAVSEGRVPRAMVEDVLKNPAPILAQVQLFPAFADGKWAGLRATFVKKGSVIATLGLQRGDVIRAVNGKPLDSVQSAMAALEVIGSKSDIDVELVRSGQVVVKRLRID